MRRITAVWGTGNYFNQIFNKLKHYVEIDYLIDSDTNKVGKRLTQKQIECILPKQIAEKNISLILIAVIDKAQCREIVKYLEFNKIKYDYADYYMDSLEIQRINSFNYNPLQI